MARDVDSIKWPCRVVGWALFVAGLLLGIYAAVSAAVPEGSWAPQGGLSTRWLLAGIGILLMLAGFGVLRAGQRVCHDTPDTFLDPEEDQQVVDAIGRFERLTSGEIRVHLAARSGGDVMEAALEIFHKLGMTGTRGRNGVLFYVDVDDHRLAVLGDSGIDAVTPDNFWDAIVAEVEARFRAGDYAGGLVTGIERAGEALAAHFPYEPGDVNELPDEVSRG